MTKRLIMITLLAIGALLPMAAEDVTYLTTGEFKARIFDYTANRDWQYKGDQPCVIDFSTTW